MKPFCKRFRARSIFALCASLSCISAVSVSADPSLHVVPWNGYKGAVSLTFDDGDPTQVEFVVPELNKRGLKATFFLISSKISSKNKWRKITSKGHEIASHTYSHQHAKKIDDMNKQTKTARVNLSHDFHCQVTTFAYPYMEITSPLKKSVSQNYFAARGGWGKSFYMLPDDTPDWYNIPSQVAHSEMPLSNYCHWIDTAESKGAWTVLMLHAIEGGVWGWQPLKKKVFTGILDKLRESHVWIAPFGTVCSYWKAQKIFEKSKPAATDNRLEYKWDIPAHFPKDVHIKVTAGKASGGIKLYQHDTMLVPDKNGVYSIDFDAKELTCEMGR